MIRWRPVLVALALAASSGAVLGCGGDDDTDQAQTTTSTAASADRLLAIEADGTATALGQLELQTASPADAEAAFGPPSSPSDSATELCELEWADLGLLIYFANLGGADPCGPDGRIGSVELRGTPAEEAGWATEDGARVGMTLDELRELYPDATRQGGQTVLITREAPFGPDGTTPTLSAETTGDEVSALVVSVGAAGE